MQPPDPNLEAAEGQIAPEHEADALASLVGSRICHDMANPVGAIANGVELVTLGGISADGPEVSLVADSVAHATARLRFYRVTYGVAGSRQMLGPGETRKLLSDAYGKTRLSVHWDITGDQPRALVKLAFLLLQCAEVALPRGGTARVSIQKDRWRIEAAAERIATNPALFALLAGGPIPLSLPPSQVQFALAPRAAASLERTIGFEDGAGKIALGF